VKKLLKLEKIKVKLHLFLSEIKIILFFFFSSANEALKAAKQASEFIYLL
jgi:hypothetical protein